MKIMQMSLAGLICFVGVSGCSTNIVESAKAISSAGQDYSTSIDSLMDSLSEKIIDHDNDFIKRKRSSLDGLSVVEIDKDFDRKNENIHKIVVNLDKLKETSFLLKKYFSLLGDVAGNNDSYGDSIKASTSNFIDSVNNLYSKNGAEAEISENEKGYVSDISSIAAKSIRAGKIKSFIKDTAVPVGKLIAYNDFLIKAAKVSFEKMEMVKVGLVKNELYQKFRSGNIDEDWFEKRKYFVKSTLKFAELKDTVEKSDKLKKGWFDMVEGKNSLKSFAADLKDLSDALKVVGNFKQEKEKANE